MPADRSMVAVVADRRLDAGEWLDHLGRRTPHYDARLEALAGDLGREHGSEAPLYGLAGLHMAGAELRQKFPTRGERDQPKLTVIKGGGDAA
jgi:hypothetical protein